MGSRSGICYTLVLLSHSYTVALQYQNTHSYLAPLLDANGRLAFFIGGQINCSTTIRSNTDVLRILSMSDDPEDDVEGQKSIRSIKPAKRSFFGFGKKETTPQIPSSTKRVEVREAGMEQGLLKQIEKMNFRTQMEAFYTAYSKVGFACGAMELD